MVIGLESFLKNSKLCKNGTSKVKLEDEIHNFIKEFPGTKPVILFDFKQCLEMFNGADFEVLYAGRHTECVRRARVIFDKLKNGFGCDLIFYIDAAFKEHKLSFLCKNANDKYKKQVEIIDKIKSGTDLSNIKPPSKNITLYNHNLLILIKEYGKLIISIENECKLDLGEYAMKNKISGVFTSDLDFLIMPGDWPIWSPNDFDINDFTTTKWNKPALRTSLDLSQEQMPLFATLLGNDIMLLGIIKPFVLGIGKGKKDLFAIAKYIKDNYPSGVITPEQICSLSNEISSLDLGRFSKTKTNIECRIFKSLNFYNCKKSYREEPQWIKNYVNKTNCGILWNLFRGLVPLQIRQPYIDIRGDDVKPFCELVSVIICRMLGIVFSDKNGEYIRREIVCKESYDEPFKRKTITPIFPPSDKFERVPNISRLIEANEGLEKVPYPEKISILLWIVSSGNPKRNRRVNLHDWIDLSESIYFVPVLILNYLVKDYQITHNEADVVLLSIHEAYTTAEEKMKNMKPPEIKDLRSFWIAHTYIQLSYYFKCALGICGLYNLLRQDFFDGYIFFEMSAKYLKLGDEQRTALLDPIRRFRLYCN